MIKIWFKNSDSTVPISFGKSVGEADESSFDWDGDFPLGYDHEYYDISGGDTLVANPTKKIAVDLARQNIIDDRINRIAEITSKLTGMTLSQLDSYVDANVTDLASARTYLKRLTMIVQYIAKEMNL